MPPERNSLIQSVRLSKAGFSVQLRIKRSRPQELEEFLRENDLSDRIDFEPGVPVSLSSATESGLAQLSAA